MRKRSAFGAHARLPGPGTPGEGLPGAAGGYVVQMRTILIIVVIVVIVIFLAGFLRRGR